MNDLVRVEKGEVMTNSFNIYADTGKTHAHVTRDIDKLIEKLTIQKRRVSDYFIKNTYKNARNREYKTYDMTRDGFVLLAMGYNKEKFMCFKLKYIDAFNNMEKELKEAYVSRRIGIETRKVLTDHIEESGENKRMHGHGFSTYTKLAYKFAGIDYVKPPKGIKFRDTLSKDQLSRVDNIEGMMKALIQIGKQYGEIKKNMEGIFKPMICEK